MNDNELRDALADGTATPTDASNAQLVWCGFVSFLPVWWRVCRIVVD